MDWLSKYKYHYWAFGSFLILAAIGVLLRLMQLINLPIFNYSYLLHAHSHFAFAGFTFLGIAMLIYKKISLQHFLPVNRVFMLTLVSAFGMLIAFSMQGYKAVSIGFSLLFIVANYSFAHYTLRSEEYRLAFGANARIFLNAALVYLVLSSIGPLALGPLVAAGLKYSPYYKNAIYFYLHFQMNGWMLLGVLGLLLHRYPLATQSPHAGVWLKVFSWSTAPVYLIFTLWNKPPVLLSLVAVVSVLIHLISWIRILKYLKHHSFPLLLKISLIAISFKALTQVLVCIPMVGLWVFSDRNLIIGYIHLITLACIMPVMIYEFIAGGFLKPGAMLNVVNALFVLFVIIYLVLLFARPFLALFHIFIPQFQVLLLIVSVFLFLAGVGYVIRLKR